MIGDLPNAWSLELGDGTAVYFLAVAHEDELMSEAANRGISTDFLDGIKSSQRRIEKLGTHILLHHIFDGKARLCHAPSGAPYLEGLTEQVWISITHTIGLVAVAVSSSHAVGIDVEQCRDRVLRVRSRFLCADELAAAGDDISANTVAWTAKEAIYKIMNRSAVDFAEHINLSLPTSITQEFQWAATDAWGKNYALHTMFLDAGMVLTSCCHNLDK